MAETPSLLTPKLLSFDVYATLIDWEPGIMAAASPLLSRLSSPPSKADFLRHLSSLEGAEQRLHPDKPYPQVLATCYTQLCDHYNSPLTSATEAKDFGNSIKNWQPFPDTVDALKRLKKFYKLVVLSNVDNQSFFEMTEPLLGGKGTFDLVLTAEMIGSYKPDLRNFRYMLEKAESEFGIKKEQVCITAMSLTHDHKPGKELGLMGAFIDRKGAVMGLPPDGEKIDYDWRFETLGEMADAVEKEAREKGVEF